MKIEIDWATSTIIARGGLVGNGGAIYETTKFYDPTLYTFTPVTTGIFNETTDLTPTTEGMAVEALRAMLTAARASGIGKRADQLTTDEINALRVPILIGAGLCDEVTLRVLP